MPQAGYGKSAYNGVMNSLRSASHSGVNASITSSTVRPTAASTSERLDIAQKLLLAPFGLTEAHLSRALGEITSHGADDADLYFQYTRSEGWSLEEGIVKKIGRASCRERV